MKKAKRNVNEAFQDSIIECIHGCVTRAYAISDQRLEKMGRGEELEESVHGLRVGFRRMLSLLDFLRPVLKKKRRLEAVGDARFLLKCLATSREAHIYRKAYQRFVSALDAEGEVYDAESHLEFAREIDAAVDNEERQLRILWEMEGQAAFLERYAALRHALLHTVPEDFRRKSQGYATREAFFEGRMEEIMESIRMEAKELDLEESESVHRFRVACKRMLYVMEEVELISGTDLGVWKSPLKAVQDIAGRIQDARVNLSLLKSTSPSEKLVCRSFARYLEEEGRRSRKKLAGVLEEIQVLENPKFIH